MKWNVIFDPDFKLWFYQQEQELQDEVFSVLTVLMEFGPSLGRPRVDTLEGSSIKNLKELRIQYKGDPWRILFAFDPERQAILLVGGNKTGNKRWYKENIAIAERRYENYLEQLKEEEP
ncbi:type II toxin-antitoxin system RelE/ParE family toxin [Roseofilum sp. BLCC_M91]|uniref:Type II toxin-antitoxin system RelE/ParE family toxin n=1 Tax=Roseofilum halophilum BLCC-M91 TaxID=3022259 RepID=A0ABT7BR59_9CYAN|nr:type II toxin-antitoxin system RelE/ParE family toxin [Roseofilum halophilum]MDJ1181237.1 type II toxin-antitoxin system RelE/ParE family toxin [Roseofilum halophilum BLCC-M91]